MTGKTTREDVLIALRAKARGMTTRELNAFYPKCGYDPMDAILRDLYDDGLVVLDVASNPRVARWVAV